MQRPSARSQIWPSGHCRSVLHCCSELVPPSGGGLTLEEQEPASTGETTTPAHTIRRTARLVDMADFAHIVHFGNAMTIIAVDGWRIGLAVHFPLTTAIRVNLHATISCVTTVTNVVGLFDNGHARRHAIGAAGVTDYTHLFLGFVRWRVQHLGRGGARAALTSLAPLTGFSGIRCTVDQRGNSSYGNNRRTTDSNKPPCVGSLGDTFLLH